jgi:hypothetical protein
VVEWIHDVAESTIAIFKGSMYELAVGAPRQFSTVLSVVIDGPAGAEQQGEHDGNRRGPQRQLDRDTAASAPLSRHGQSVTGSHGVVVRSTGNTAVRLIRGPDQPGITLCGYPVTVTVDQQTGLNYSHPATAGWGGDVVVPYSNGSDNGYVFKSVWDSQQDATEFRDAYIELLESKGATKVSANTWVIDDGPWADAFRVVQTGSTLLVVNAPTVENISSVHAPA